MTQVTIGDGPNLDSFSRLRVSQPFGLFDAQFTYDLAPLQYEQITAESGAAIAHDATNRCATMTFNATPTGGKAIMQSYEYVRYQPGRSQAAFITFNPIEAKANVVKFAGLSDGVNGVEVQLSGSTVQFVLYSGTTNSTQIAVQSEWNIDAMRGRGARGSGATSGITLDMTKEQIFVVDLQALYVGRVRVGFDIGGQVIYCHEFNHANLIATPYIQYATLPVRCGMTCTGEVSTTMRFICASVISEGGQEDNRGITTVVEGLATAVDAADTHVLSIRPKALFNGIANRTKFFLSEFTILVTGNNAVRWKVVIGQALSGTTTFADVNATYSAMEFNTAGTLSSTPALVLAQGYCPASAQTKGATTVSTFARIPITLNAAGAARLNGTISLIAQGIGANSTCRATFTWTELR